ncbi:MAG: hypothetical protein ACKOPR_02750 [Chakrabartia godavariana]
MRLFLALFLILVPSFSYASESVALDSSVYVERIVPEANGRTRTVLEPPKVVTPGDRLVFILQYRNTGTQSAKDFVVTNPMPAPVAYQGTSDTVAQVSVDGGKTFAALAALKVREADGTLRAARPEDVTHVRWALREPIAAGAQGKLSFRGIVR